MVRLTAFDGEVFDVYAHWTYTGALDVDLAAHSGNVHSQPVSLYLSKIWVLAHFLGGTDLCNQIVDKIFELLDGGLQGTMGLGVATYVCNNTTPNSKLRFFCFMTLWPPESTTSNSSIMEWNILKSSFLTWLPDTFTEQHLHSGDQCMRAAATTTFMMKAKRSPSDIVLQSLGKMELKTWSKAHTQWCIRRVVPNIHCECSNGRRSSK